MTIFTYDSKFSRIMMRLSYGCYLNLLWFVFSLPVVTMGASTCALYGVALQIAKGEEPPIARSFMAHFRTNLKQATQVWLVLLLAAAILGCDIYVLSHLIEHATGALAVVLTVALAFVIVACLALLVTLTFVFPLISQVHNTNWEMIKNSFLIGTHYLFCTICVLGIHVLAAILIIAFFTPLMVFGEGVCAVLSAYLLLPVIRACTTQSDQNPSTDAKGIAS